MAAYFGFGLGFFFHKNSDKLLALFPGLLAILSVIIGSAYAFNLTHLIFVDPREYFILGSGFNDHSLNSIPSPLIVLRSLSIMTVLFFLMVAIFASLAAKIGSLLEQEKPLRGYSINVLGSFIGISGFTLASYFHLPPHLWFIFALVPMLYFYRTLNKKLLPAFIFFSITILSAGISQQINGITWSPYYHIILNHGKDNGYINLAVNYDSFQVIQNLSDAFLKTLPEDEKSVWFRHYNIPYELSRKKINSVLILGGGAGNDAAIALQNGATDIDVVEIDPVIASYGKTVHPQRPYLSPFVTLHVDDARSYLQKSKKLYDLVVFATLDSHAVFSSLSSLRMDNFIFTQDAVEMAKNRLRPEAGIAINFFTIKPWLSQRHVNTLTAVMGKKPIAYESASFQEAILLSGGIFDSNKHLSNTGYVQIDPQFTNESVEPTSDDWPFLFLEKKGFPLHYLLPLLIVYLFAAFSIRITGLSLRSTNWHLFFMGAAFFLLESKAVTALALLFGSTWLVNAIVIGSILIMILVANALAEHFERFSYGLFYAGLSIMLILNFVTPLNHLNEFSLVIRLAAAGFLVGSPLFFAALIFARSFSKVSSPSAALASNLLGALLGGFVEYFDMWTGLRWLTILALIFYGLSYFFLATATKRDILRIAS